MRFVKLTMKWLLGFLFVFAGVSHFLRSSFFVSIVPPYLPWPLALVYISGVFEVVLGMLLLIPRTRRVAAWGLIALLVAVFPANLHMAFHPDSYPEFSPVALWARLPFQGLFIAWAFWFTRRTPSMQAKK
jgi:uncharacterized membrane protein